MKFIGVDDRLGMGVDRREMMLRMSPDFYMDHSPVTIMVIDGGTTGC